jgi:ubiquinone/menaquinone biosynthesis C-methylase UbiE
MESLAEEYFILDSQELVIEDFKSDGYILDIGGGGEGIIGRLKGDRVVAIDVNEDELNQAPEGPLKILMDARNLNFLDNSFSVVTAFFSLMYIKGREDQQEVFREIRRVLRPGGSLYVWDVEIPERPETDKDVFLVLLNISVGGDIVETGYGQRWPQEPRGVTHYEMLARDVSLKIVHREHIGSVFHLELAKELAYEG